MQHEDREHLQPLDYQTTFGTFIKRKTKNPETSPDFYFKELAATYSRRTYRTTTIGKAMFDGRVRNGNGSDHSFMATKLNDTDFDRTYKKNRPATGNSLKTTHRRLWTNLTIRELKFAFQINGKAIKPHDRLVLVN